MAWAVQALNHPPSLFLLHFSPTSKFQKISRNIKFPSTTSLIVSASASASEFADRPSGVEILYKFRVCDPSLVSGSREKVQQIAGIDQGEFREAKSLADPDSQFYEFNGVKIHYKVLEPKAMANNSHQTQNHSLSVSYINKKISLPTILLHGFGASIFSWNRAMKPLVEVTGSKVLAFDRPAFGLTSRVNYFPPSSSVAEDTKPLNPYSLEYSVHSTLHFIDLLGAEKAVLVGHSAGSIVAVNTYFQAPERISALVLIAPAIVAPHIRHKVASKYHLQKDTEGKDDFSHSNNMGNIFIQISNFLMKVAAVVVQKMIRIVNGVKDRIKIFWKQIFSAFLRSSFFLKLVRMVIDRFGVAAIRNAWFDSSKLNEHILEGYTKPLKIKDWDKALVEYTVAMLTETDSGLRQPVSKRLHEISCPVLIVTGDNDRIVPAWNSERLSRAIPGACLEVIKHCGHLPHEEKVEEFVSVVQRFLHRVLGVSEEQSLAPNF